MSLIYVDLKQAPLSRLPFRQQRWYWVARSGDNQKKLARSTERYTNRGDAVTAIAVLFGSSSNVYRREAEHGNIELRLASPF